MVPARSQPNRLGPAALFLALPLGFLVLFFFIPMAIMVASSLTASDGASPSLANYAEFATKPVLWGALWNSVELTGLTVLLTLPLAYALAAAIAFGVSPRWQPVILALIVLPFFASYIVRTYAWLLVLSDKGVINTALMYLGLTEEPIRLVNDRVGVLIVFIHYFVMIMALAIYVNLVRIPTNQLRAAADLGAGPLRVFASVILPQSLPGIAVGVFLTIVIAVGDYVTPQVIGGGQELTLPQAIMLQIGRFSDVPMAATLSFVLTLCILAALAIFSPWLTSRRVS